MIKNKEATKLEKRQKVYNNYKKVLLSGSLDEDVFESIGFEYLNTLEFTQTHVQDMIIGEHKIERRITSINRKKDSNDEGYFYVIEIDNISSITIFGEGDKPNSIYEINDLEIVLFKTTKEVFNFVTNTLVRTLKIGEWVTSFNRIDYVLTYMQGSRCFVWEH